MKAIAAVVATLTCLSLAAQAAQPPKVTRKEKKLSASVIARYDKNGNGVIDADEVAAIQRAFNSDPALKTFDKNHDGKLDDEEVSDINPAPKKKKK